MLLITGGFAGHISMIWGGSYHKEKNIIQTVFSGRKSSFNSILRV